MSCIKNLTDAQLHSWSV